MRRIALCCLVLLAGCSLGPDLPALPERERLPLQSRVDRRYEDVLADPSSAAANGELGVVVHQFLDNANAEILYHRAFLLDPSTFDWLYYIGVVQAAQDKYDPAAASLRHGLRLNPDYQPAKLLLAKMTFRMNNLVESESLAQELAVDPAMSAYADYRLALIASQRENHRAAADACRRACDKYAEFGDAHELWAHSARKLGEKQIAKEHFLLADEYRFRTPPLGDPLLEKVHGDSHQGIASSAGRLPGRIPGPE